MKLAPLVLLTVFAFALLTPMLAAPIPEGANAEASTLIVLDASGSMLERIKGETKIDIAKRSVCELVAGLPEGTNLGLVVYSHRKTSDCDDIELLIPAGKLDKPAFTAAVNSIKPRGRTPLAGALEFAAAALNYTKRPANVILVSDGIETCGKDPAAMAARLEKAGARFTVHTVAFDLSAKDAKSIRAIATATGGRFLQAKDANSLKDALSVAVAEVAAPAPAPRPAAAPAAVEKPGPPSPEPVTPVSIKAPPTVLAGAEFSVGWTGPDRAGDFLTMVIKGSPDDEDGNLAYTRQGSPLRMTALIEPGDAELRYIAGDAHAVLGRASIKISSVEATLAAVDSIVAGSPVTITWKGPGNDGDFITIVARDAADRDYAHYANTRDGSPLVVAAPADPGDAEIRYLSGLGGKALARRPIKVIAAEVSLSAPGEVIAEATVEIAWTGPNNKGDYVTLVGKSAPDGSHARYAYTAQGSPLAVIAPSEPGDGEIRYMSEGNRVLARRAIKITPAQVGLSAAEETAASSLVEITWTGPNNQGDYITIVEGGRADGEFGAYRYTAEGASLRIQAPDTVGAGEIRYMSGQGDRVLARRAIRIVAANITLNVPARTPLGMPVAIAWTGPNNPGDYITVVPKDAPDGTYGDYANTADESTVRLNPPEAPGACEVRYMNADNKVLARVGFELVDADASP